MNISQAYDDIVESGALKDDPAQRPVLPQLDRIQAELAKKSDGGFFAKIRGTKPKPIKGLYLWGGVGRGKSMLMDLFFDTIGETRKRRVHFHAFMQEVHSEMHRIRKTGVDDALAPVADKIANDLRLLCFDEMQITDITDAMIVGRLFERLMANDTVIVTTSNRVPDDLYKDGLNRSLFLPFIELIKEQLVVHELISDTDHRQKRLAGSQTYFTPLSDTSTKAVDDIWGMLTGGETEPLVLKVKSRDVVIPSFRNGAGRANFAELCGQPLGPGDYLEIAKALRVLVIDDIPILSRENNNEAKRFVTLIDTLYEAGVRLIASAAAEPEELYQKGAGAFEFERTASRLREMQSADWGNAD